MIRIVCLSDTHSKHRQVSVPDGDVLIHAGDATLVGDIDELADFDYWLGGLPHRHKIVIAGNHDWLFQTNPRLARSLLTHAFYLQDGGIECEGLKVYGSPWQPWFMDWAFNLPRRSRALAEKWEMIPFDTDVLITHGPPFGVLDEATPGESAGCEALAAAVFRIRPRLHVFGHIHEGYGVREWQGIKFANASACDAAYRPINPPLVFDVARQREA